MHCTCLDSLVEVSHCCVSHALPCAQHSTLHDKSKLALSCLIHLCFTWLQGSF